MLSAAVTSSDLAGNGTTWVATFAANGAAADSTGGLPDGVYRLTLHAALLAGAAGGPALAADQGFTFHRLFGDADGNGSVNALDYAQFKKRFGTTFAY